MAGKTGTARKARVAEIGPDGKLKPVRPGYYEGRYVVSFAGFLPAENPEIVGFVVVDDPKAEGVTLYGGTIVAPIWKKMAEKAVRLLEIAPEHEREEGLTQISGASGD